MTKPLTHNRVDIKAILADPLLREELIEGATDFICKVEGIRRRKEDLEMTNQPLSPAARAVLDAAVADVVVKELAQRVAAALQAAADQVVPETTTPWNSTLTPMISAGEVRAKLLAIVAELKGGNG